MSEFNVGDIVRIGKGNVDYRIESIKMHDAILRSVTKDTKRSAELTRLVIVQRFEPKPEVVETKSLEPIPFTKNYTRTQRAKRAIRRKMQKLSRRANRK